MDSQITSKAYEPLGIGAGTQLDGRYNIVRKLGAGGMSAVYEARDKNLDLERVALKLLAPQLVTEKAIVERFRNEVIITRKLTHPNIVRTFDFGQLDSGQLFLTMECVDGRSLEELRRSHGRLPIPATLRVVAEVLKAIEYAHKEGVIHRDLKPGNVLISDDGAIKITDFGLARSLEINSKLTQAGECVGTPFYMSPEQVEGTNIDGRADLYSVGIIVYEMLTGELPFRDESWYSLATKILKEPLPTQVLKHYKLPQWLQDFIVKATNKSPDLRFSSASEMLKEIRSHVGDDFEASLDFAATRKLQARVTQPLSSAPIFSQGRLIQIAPFILAAGVASMLIIVGAEIGKDKAKEVNQSLEEGKETISNFVDTVTKLHEAVIFSKENKDAINNFIDDSQAKKSADTKTPVEKKSDQEAAITPDLNLSPE